jgi:hypothetical protein
VLNYGEYRFWCTWSCGEVEAVFWERESRRPEYISKQHNGKDTQKLFDAALDTISTEDWNNAIKHVLNVEHSYWEKDNIIDIDIDQIIIKLSEDSDDSSNSTTCSDNDSD